jgi:hypothetical protein
MATATAGDIVKKALQKIGVLADGETATASQMNDGFDSLGSLLDSWSARSLLTSAVISESFILTPGQSIYSFGVGGNFNSVKPFSIEGAFIRDNQNLDYGVDIVSRDVYDAYGDKAVASVSTRPTNLFYSPGDTQQATQTGTVFLYPIPDATSTYTLFLDSEKPFTPFTSLVNNIAFPPAYVRAMIFNLAIEICSDYGRPVPQEVLEIAHESMRIIENVNARNRKAVAGMGLPGAQKTFNIYSDDYNT